MKPPPPSGRKILALLAAALLGAAWGARPAWTQERLKPRLKKESREPLPPDVDVIDAPTAAVLDYGAMTMTSRFGHDGNALTSLGFGLLQRLQFGASLSTDKLVGTASPILLNRPELQLRFRFFDGSRSLPAAAVGFDGQGYFHDRNLKTYLEKGRGFYLVGSEEAWWPGLMVHPGLSISDFDTNAVSAFLGTSYNIDNHLTLLAELDNIQAGAPSRLNVGARLYITGFFNLTFALRELGQSGSFENGTDRGIERIAVLRYIGNF